MSQARTPTAQDAKFDDLFDKTNNEMGEALKQLEANEVALQKLKNQKEVGYFSSAKLQYEFAFEEKTERQFIEASSKQKTRIKEIMAANKRAYDEYQKSLKEYNDKYSANKVKLNVDRSFLIADLLEWKKTNTVSPLARLKGEVDKQKEEVIAKIGAEEELRKKSLEELRDIGKLIHDDKLLRKQALDLYAASHFNDVHFKETQPKTPELMAYDRRDMDELNKVLASLTAKYQTAAKSLSARSHETFETIAKDNKKIKDEMKQVLDKINQAKNSFIQAKAEYENAKTFDNCQKMFNKYSQYYALVNDLKKHEKDYAKWKKQADDILQRYERAKVIYGDYPAEEVAKVRDQVEQHKRELELFQRQVKDIGIGLKELNVMYVAHKILCLIKIAIENNLDFWAKQVSLAGSKSKIKDISVPTGIHLLHEKIKLFDPCQMNAKNEDILESITHGVRLRGATNKNHALRKDGTTDLFYKQIGDVWVECLKTNDDPNQILLMLKNRLKKIVDKKKNVLMLDESPKQVAPAPKPLDNAGSPLKGGADQKHGSAGGAANQKFFSAAAAAGVAQVGSPASGSKLRIDLDAMERELDALTLDASLQALSLQALSSRPNK